MGVGRDGRSPWPACTGQFDPVRVAAFLVTFACGTAIAYSFMLMLTSLSVWMVRNQSLMEMWWLFTSLARYPKEIFLGTLGRAAGLLLHVRPADPAGRQRPGQRDGPGPRPGDGGLHPGRDRRLALGQPPILPARPAVVPERQQLTRASPAPPGPGPGAIDDDRDPSARSHAPTLARPAGRLRAVLPGVLAQLAGDQPAPDVADVRVLPVRGDRAEPWRRRGGMTPAWSSQWRWR